MNKELQIPMRYDSIRDFYTKYLNIIRPLIGLRQGELDVFIEFLILNYENRHVITDADRAVLVLGYDARKDIEKRLGISDARLRNCVSILRKKEIIVSNKIVKYAWISPENCEKVSYNFIEHGRGNARESGGNA